jgi:hypothetical protein
MGIGMTRRNRIVDHSLCSLFLLHLLAKKKEIGSDSNTDDTDAANENGSLGELFTFFREIMAISKTIKKMGSTKHPAVMLRNETS